MRTLYHIRYKFDNIVGMDKALYDSLNKLKASMEKDPRVLELNEVDKRLSLNEEVMKLSYKKDMALTSYEDACKHFGETSSEALAKQKELYLAKLELDNHPLVREYNEKYQAVRLMYDEVNKELFGDFISKHKCR